MARYFIFGNVWLLVALLLFVECRFARSDPYMVSFTDRGAWMYPGTYNALVGLCVLASVVCFVLTALTHRRVERS